MWTEGGEAETRKRSYQRSRRSDHKYAMMKMTDGRTDGGRDGRPEGTAAKRPPTSSDGRTDAESRTWTTAASAYVYTHHLRIALGEQSVSQSVSQSTLSRKKAQSRFAMQMGDQASERAGRAGHEPSFVIPLLASHSWAELDAHARPEPRRSALYVLASQWRPRAKITCACGCHAVPIRWRATAENESTHLCLSLLCPRVTERASERTNDPKRWMI